MNQEICPCCKSPVSAFNDCLIAIGNNYYHIECYENFTGKTAQLRCLN